MNRGHPCHVVFAVGADRLPHALLRAETQPGGVYLPVGHRHVRTPVLPRKPQGG